MYLDERPRRLRTRASMRDLVRETVVNAHDLVMPVFVCNGVGVQEQSADLPMIVIASVDMLESVLQPQIALGLRGVLLFARVDEADKSEDGAFAVDASGLVPTAVRAIRQLYPDLTVMTDVALDPYTTHGHDGLVADGIVVNDATVDVLVSMALVHAQAGAHVIAPSDMMDGRVAAIRSVLDEHGYTDVSIMSYTAKYASCLYGPFRTILASAPKQGNKLTYQMDPGNGREAARELRLDLAEGADIAMVKPAMWYLDVVHRFSLMSDRPVAAYHTSGEAAMILMAAERGHLELMSGIVEATTAIKRAGASIIVTYFTMELLSWIKQR